MRKKYDFTSKQIHVKVFPNLRQSQWEVQMLVSREKKSDFTSKQIHMTGFPNLRQLVSHPLTLRAFLDTLWWTSVILFGCRQVSKHMGGLIHQKKWVATSFHWVEAHQRFRSRSQGVATAVSVFVRLKENINKYWDGNAVYFLQLDVILCSDQCFQCLPSMSLSFS